LEDKPEPNLDKVINNIQVELIKSIRPIVPLVGLKEHVVASIVEPAHVENPQFFITQIVLVFSHSINNLKQLVCFRTRCSKCYHLFKDIG
jgi:hypothetical protein